jgi:hypothetical protein
MLQSQRSNAQRKTTWKANRIKVANTAARQECRSQNNHRPARSRRTRCRGDRWLVTRSRGGRHRDLNETRLICEHPNDATKQEWGSHTGCLRAWFPPRAMGTGACLLTLQEKSWTPGHAEKVRSQFLSLRQRVRQSQTDNLSRRNPSHSRGLKANCGWRSGRQRGDQTTNLGVRSSNLFGRATKSMI